MRHNAFAVVTKQKVQGCDKMIFHRRESVVGFSRESWNVDLLRAWIGLRGSLQVLTCDRQSRAHSFHALTFCWLILAAKLFRLGRIILQKHLNLDRRCIKQGGLCCTIRVQAWTFPRTWRPRCSAARAFTAISPLSGRLYYRCHLAAGRSARLFPVHGEGSENVRDQEGGIAKARRLGICGDRVASESGAGSFPNRSKMDNRGSSAGDVRAGFRVTTSMLANNCGTAIYGKNKGRFLRCSVVRCYCSSVRAFRLHLGPFVFLRFSVTPSTLTSQRRRNERPQKRNSPEKLLKHICRILRAGNYADVACAAVGIATTSYYRWLEEAETRGGLFREFRDAVTAASARAETEALAVIQSAKTPEQAKWFLERRFAERWGRREAVVQKFNPFDHPELAPNIRFVFEGGPPAEQEIVDERGREKPPAR